MALKLTVNNFDLLRLFAATQVAILHTADYLSPSWGSNPVIKLLYLFPGVPIFFFISGFLISSSYEKNSVIREYAQNRALRIFPALHACLIINLLLIAATGYFSINNVALTEIGLLYLAKTTIFQFYNPEFMRGFGDGVLNGSLWTICVELQFYFLTPLIYKLAITSNNTSSNVKLIALIFLSLACNRALYATQADFSHLIIWKLTKVSFLPWIYMFLCGALVQRNFTNLKGLLANKKILWSLPLYIVLAATLSQHGFRVDNGIGPMLFLPLAATVISLAFTAPQLAKKILNGNDISYGIYIYHVPIMNMFIYYGITNSSMSTFLSVSLSIGAAAISWLLIEKPSLRLKARPLNPLTSKRQENAH